MENLANEYWCYLKVDSNGLILSANERAAELLGEALIIGSHVKPVLPWLRKSWFGRKFSSRIVKTSISDKYLLDIIKAADEPDCYHVLFRNFYEYQDLEHLWCEVADSIIGVQRFIDTSYDGIMVTDGACKVMAVNDAYLRISGLARETIIGKYMQDLVDEGVVPYSCSVHAARERRAVSASVKFFQGKDSVVSSTPLLDEKGEIIRIISNVRDISELNNLHEKLKNIKGIAKGYQRELKAIQLANTDTNRLLIRSRVMETLYDLVMKVADTDLQILITGESGVGKTAMAKFIHAASDRHHSGNFIHVNCSSIPESLLEAELFGFEEGSFTGAKRMKAGLFELAHKGTLFLDEIGDMPLQLQAKILNVLQEHKYYRVGGTKEVGVDVRVIAATNTNLEQRIAKGLFRQDLFYRLNVIPVRIPPLSERKEDLLPLIAHYLEKANQRYKRDKVIARESLDILLKYNWPGNIRQLINMIERIVVIVDSPVVEVHHLAEVAENAELLKIIQATERQRPEDRESKRLWQPTVPLRELVQAVEEKIIEEAIQECGSVKLASKSLGVDVTTLIRKRNRKNREPAKG
jgi:PAS domain S-box-containing protein